MSDIVLTGTIVLALQPQSGVSQRGNQWMRQSYVIEHEHGQYPKRAVFDVKDAKIQELNLQVGENVAIHLNLDCREYPENSGKFFNSLVAWKAERQMQQGYQQPVQGGWPQQQAWGQQPPQQFANAPVPPQYQQPMQGQQMPPQQPMQQAQSPFPPQAAAPQQAQQQFPPQQGVQQPQNGQLPFPPAQ